MSRRITDVVAAGGWEKLTPARLAISYTALGLTWIILSDAVLAWRADEPLVLHLSQLLKGTGFVIATGLLLWLLLRQYMRALIRSQQRYLQSQRMLSTLLSNLPGMAYRCRNDDRFTLLFASEGSRELTGQDLAAATADTGDGPPPGFAEFIDPEDLERVQREVADAVEADRPFRLTYRIRHADGSTRWVWEQGRAVSDGQILEGFITDITEQMHAQESLRRSERRYRMLVDTAMEGVAILDRRARIRFVNPQMANLLGYDVADIIDRRVMDFIDPDRADDVEQRLRRRWEGESDQYETRFVRRDGTHVWAIVTTNPIFDDDGRVTGALGMITDITQRVAAEQKLRESERRYRDLADSRKLLLNELDHRVKNNLAGLHALLSMYARNATTVDDFAEFMRQKLVAMTTVHEMITAANWEPIRLRDLIRHTSSQFRGIEAEDKAIDVEGPVVTIAPRQAGPLIMILHELLTNSRKHGAYSRPGGRISISWTLAPADDGDRRLTLRWVESGGPATRHADATPGLGLDLVQGFVRHELNGAFTYELTPAGFHCAIEGILDPVTQTQRADAAPA